MYPCTHGDSEKHGAVGNGALLNIISKHLPIRVFSVHQSSGRQTHDSIKIPL